MKPDRKFFAEVLAQATREMVERQGRDILFAAPLAVHVRDILRRKLADEHLEANGNLYGAALFPALSPADHATLKFRSFLEIFPELVEVFRGPSGDMVRVLDTDQAQRIEEYSAHYKRLLIDGLIELSRLRKEPIIPTIQLVKWLKKRDPGFHPRRVGFQTLADWLESLKDIVELTHRDYGGRVRLIKQPERMVNASSGAGATPAGYLLVDSVDLLSALHEILGTKPSAAQLPDWGQLLRYLKERFPAADWKGRYFLATARHQADSMEGFRTYLEAVGFVVIQLAVPTESTILEDVLRDRTAATRAAIVKMLTALPGHDAHVFVVSHSDEIALPFVELLARRRPNASCGVIGFPEKMPPSFKPLQARGAVIIDLEADAHVFKASFPRRRPISPDSFDPTKFL